MKSAIGQINQPKISQSAHLEFEQLEKLKKMLMQ